MKTITLLLTLPVLIFTKIEIDITASDDKTQQELATSGSFEDIISDLEIQTFQLSDDNLKAAVNEHFGVKPDDVFLKSPTPWGDLYVTNGWKQVSRTLKPLKATVLSTNFRPYFVYREVFNNNSTKVVSIRARIWKAVEDTVSSSWERSRLISASQDIKYGFDIKAMAISGNATFSFNSQWGESFMMLQQVMVGSETGLVILLQPKQSVIAELFATRGSMRVKVDFVASLSGSVAVNYAELYKDHHFWSVDINKVLVAGGLNETVTSSEIIDFGFFVNSSVTIRDIGTGKVMSFLPLSVF